MSPRKPTLEAPIPFRFFKNRRKEVIAVTLSTYEGRNLVDVRQFYQNSSGQDRPTQKGVAMSVNRLPELAKAIGQALTKAQELGLIDGEAGE